MAVSRTERNSIRQRAALFMVAGAATASAGAVLFFGIQPVTDLSDEMWRYPWESSGAFLAFSIFSALLHALVGAYGLGLLSMAVALYTDPTPATTGRAGELQMQRA